MTRIASLGVVLVCVAGMGLPTLRAQVAKAPADELYREATAGLQEQDYSKAEFWSRELRAKYPQDSRWGLGLMFALEGENKIQDALKLAREIQPQYPKSTVHSVRIGTLLSKLGRTDEALVEFQKALGFAASPGDSELAYNMIGGVYLREEAYDEAIPAFRKAKEISGRPSLELAVALSMSGDDDRAMPEYRAVLRENPDQPVALNNLAYAMAERNENINEAFAMSRRAVDALPGNAPMMDTLGWLYFKKGMLDDAESTMVEALLYEGGNQGTLREHLAAVMDARGDWTTERRALRGLLESGTKPEEIARMKVLLGRVRRQ